MTLHLLDPSITTAAVTAGMYTALRAGHMLGDYPVQSDHDAQTKGYPGDEQLAIGVPWHTGLASIARHVGSYLTCQAAAVAVLALVVPLTYSGAWTALMISGASHAVIDRRWIVRAIIRAKGGCAHWPEAPAHLDQALHHLFVFLAAVAAALVTTVAGAAGVTGICAALIAVAVAWERQHGRTLAEQLVPTVRH